MDGENNKWEGDYVEGKYEKKFSGRRNRGNWAAAARVRKERKSLRTVQKEVAEADCAMCKRVTRHEMVTTDKVHVVTCLSCGWQERTD